MRYVILGASGHIGNNVVRYINTVEPKAKIICLTRRTVTKELENASCEQIIGDICDTKFLSDNIRKGDIVINCAGIIDLTEKAKEAMYKINFISAKAVADICIINKVKRLVYIGSVDGIYKEGEDLIFEPQDYYPDKMTGYYGYTKSLAMKYIHDLIANNKNITMLLPSAVIGVNDYKPSAIGNIIISVIKGKTEWGIDGGYNFVDVLDVAKAIYTACHSKDTGEYIISGCNIEIKEFYAKINTILGINKKPIIVPDFLVTLASPFVKVLNKTTIKSLKSNHNYICNKAYKELNYRPKEIDETIALTVNWFKDNFNKF